MIAMSKIRNLLPNPKPTSVGAWRQGGGSNLTVRMIYGDKMHITNNSGIPDSYIYTQLQLPAGTYRFGAEVSNPQNGYATNQLRMVKPQPIAELAPARWDGVAGRIVTPANEITADGPVELRVMVGPNRDSAIWVRNLFMMREEDYQHMIANNIAWFDGDGIVRGGGLPPSVFHPHVDCRTALVVVA